MKLYDEIARTAHDLYMKSGCVHGRDLENWYEAERIVKGRYEQEQNQGKTPDPQNGKPVVKKPAAAAANKAPAAKKAATPGKTTVKRTAKTKKTE